jgi:hypothetical protein
MAALTKTRQTEGTRVTVSYSDSINLIREQVRWTPKGVSLLTKWPFAVGAEVEFAFDHQGERHGCTGVVVACRALAEPAHHFETVLYFGRVRLPSRAGARSRVKARKTGG